jgi:membrane protein
MAKAARSGSRPLAGSKRVWQVRLRELVGELVLAFREHHLWTYASAIAFRALVALVPLTLLGLGILSAAHLQSVWTDSVAPAIQSHVTPPVFRAIDYSVDKIFSSSAGPLIAFAAALLLWDMTWAIQTTMQALNAIHDIDEPRPWWRRYLTAVALAAAVILCLVGAVLVLSVGPRPGGALHVLLGLGRWPISIVLVSVAVGLIVRYGPAERPEARWASAGSLLIVGSWIAASIAFHWWISSVANFKTAIGSLTVFLVVSAFVFVSSAIFLVGAQLDELLRKKA